MTTALDSNVLIALWDRDADLNRAAQKALDEAQAIGALVISGAGYAELLALPARSESMLDAFFAETGIRIEWSLGERAWRAAGGAFQGYVRRRNKQKDALPRRILADFLIGAHAAVHGYRLLTLDQRLYRAAFPELELVGPPM
ncbi:MAG: type II toxin-antitoxin system VapC family toxin [Acidobacteriaceae bacterium]